jgi:hypothetical protein
VRVALVRVRHRTGVCLLLEEVGMRDPWESGSLVDDGRVVDLLRHGDGVVDRRRLNGLPLDNGLD